MSLPRQVTILQILQSFQSLRGLRAPLPDRKVGTRLGGGSMVLVGGLIVLGAAGAVAGGLWARHAAAQSEGETTREAVNPQRPSRHFRIERPADLTGPDALVIYNRILDDMVAAYRLSGFDFAESYRRWRRFNTVPYRSAQHGERYVNNYGNAAAAAYRHFEDAGKMPPGAILAKDSFAVTRRGDVFTGPLFVMEKLPPGSSPQSHDWRYTMIMPDGSLFGMTGGEGTERVQFCAECHKVAGDENDDLFFVPPEYRIRFFD
ncbi:MAG: hypothetical protein D6826_00305 [Alphaproteobacteria bacterium]|nr:MAG: hypothetical protein D6826_00305 [Alphaproteobacteria bacterium]